VSRTVALDIHKRFAEVAVHEDGRVRRFGRVEVEELERFAECGVAYVDPWRGSDDQPFDRRLSATSDGFRRRASWSTSDLIRVSGGPVTEPPATATSPARAKPTAAACSSRRLTRRSERQVRCLRTRRDCCSAPPDTPTSSVWRANARREPRSAACWTTSKAATKPRSPGASPRRRDESDRDSRRRLTSPLVSAAPTPQRQLRLPRSPRES
jgi:hypothetical protein